jgi:tetratricopeptide (TPR) repeat protein
MKRVGSKLWVLWISLALSACTSPPKVIVYSSAPAPVPEVVPVVIDEGQLRRARMLADMLYQAKNAVDDNRLMLPVGNNAYDIYQQVLQLDPGNAVALEGIEEIVLRYVALAEDAINKGQYDNAAGFLNRAARLHADSADVAKARSHLASARQNQVQMQTLEPKALSAKNLEMMTQLADIAQRIRAADTTFLIHARTDEEGRWIYKTMRDAVGGYRLRGNIDIGGTPGIVITTTARNAAGKTAASVAE